MVDPVTPTTSLRPNATDDELVAHYQDLRKLARHLLLAEKRGHSLAPTDLAHEVWLRSIGQEATRGLAPEELRRRATLVMRHLLIDRARARAVRERDQHLLCIDLDALDLAATGRFADLMAVDEAIELLAVRDAALAELVRCRFFAGLSVEETAAALGLSTRTVNRDWAYAKVLLARLLRAPGS